MVDLRLRLNMPSALRDVEEMKQMFSAREKDHIRWLEELEAAMRERRPFTLARDPTKCAFGKWYSSYKTDDIGFASIMSRFESPHRRIHNIADIALNCAERGEFGKAQETIESTRAGDLSTVVRLFAEAREEFAKSQKELAVVLSEGSRHLSITVDRVDSIEPIDTDTIEEMTTAMVGIDCEFITRVARRKNGKGVVFLLEAAKLIGCAS